MTNLLLDTPRLVLFILLLPFLIEVALLRYIFHKPEWFREFGFDALWQLWRPLDESEMPTERTLFTKQVKIGKPFSREWWKLLLNAYLLSWLFLPYFLLQAWLQYTLPYWPKIL